MNNQELNRESLIIHIEGLQSVLAKRNARIAELEALVAKIQKNPIASAAEAKAYKKGWKDCAGELMEITRKTALDLSSIRKDAFKLYLEGDKAKDNNE